MFVIAMTTHMVSKYCAKLLTTLSWGNFTYDAKYFEILFTRHQISVLCSIDFRKRFQITVDAQYENFN
jgi:hypothetical protein